MGSNPSDTFNWCLESNASWANYKHHQNPQFFSKLAQGQAPKILWFGCSDSRVPETTILGLQPGDVFVHRNIANIISGNDLAFQAVLEYAVVHVKVEHVVLCGHTTCGGAAGVLTAPSIGGSLDAWLSPLRLVKREHQAELDAIKDLPAKQRRLAELNVAAGVKVIESVHFVQEAVEKRGLQVHGVLYDIAKGKLADLGCASTERKQHHLTNGTTRKAAEGEVVRGNHGMLVFGGSGASMAIKGKDNRLTNGTAAEVVRGNHGMLVFGGEGVKMAIR